MIDTIETICPANLDIPEKLEVELNSLAHFIADTVGAEAFQEMVLPTLLADEANVRRKFGPTSPSVQAMDEYHERVKMGLREPLTY